MVSVITCLHFFIMVNTVLKILHIKPQWDIIISNYHHNHIHYKTKKTFNKQVIKAGKLIVKAGYLCIIKSYINWYWQKLGNKYSAIIEPHTIVHTCLFVSTIKFISDIPRIL